MKFLKYIYLAAMFFLTAQITNAEETKPAPKAEDPKYGITMPYEGKQRQAHTRVTYPSVIGIELLGRAQFYSVFFDQAVSDNVSFGFGYGSVKTENASTGQSTGKRAHQIPLYVNYYLSRTASTVFGTAGLNFIPNASSVKDTEATQSEVRFSKQALLPTLGIGYENRSDNQFLVRVAAYALVGSTVKPWVGISVGYAF